MRRWRRVDTPTEYFVMSGALIVVTLMFLAYLIWIRLAGYPGGLPGAILMLPFLAAAVRVNRMGVYYSESGVRSRSWLRTHIVPWVSVEKFEDRPAVRNPWALGYPLPARAIWIVRWDGVRIQTPLVYFCAQVPPEGAVGPPPLPRRRWIWSERECRIAHAQLNRALALARRDLDLPA